LFFIGPKSYLLQQAMYRIAHPSMEAMDLFIVPVVRRADVSVRGGVYLKRALVEHHEPVNPVAHVEHKMLELPLSPQVVRRQRPSIRER
jgi:hypothetical protein